MHETVEIVLERGGKFVLALPHDKGARASEVAAAIALNNRYHQGPHLGVLALDLLCGRGSLIDVGANVGLYAVAAATSGSNVLAIEPQAGNALCLTLAALHNRLRNLFVLQLAAGEERRLTGLSGVEEWARVSDDDPDAAPAAMLPLDDIVELAELQRGTPYRRFLRRPGLVKIDTEGYELPVLRGAARLIERDGPDVIVECAMIEGSDCPISRNTIAVKALLEAAGYHLYLHRGWRLVPRLAGDVQEAHLCDFFATRKRYREGDRIGRFAVKSLNFAESLAWTAEMVGRPEMNHRRHAAGVVARWLREGRAAAELPALAQLLSADRNPTVAADAGHALGAIAGR